MLGPGTKEMVRMVSNATPDPGASIALGASWATEEGKTGRGETQAQTRAWKSRKGIAERDLRKGRVPSNVL